MDVVIPTYGRASKALQPTLIALTQAEITTHLVVQAREVDKYEWYKGPVLVLPDEIRSIAPTRDWIIYAAPLRNRHVLCLDDDLAFFCRRNDDREKFVRATPEDIVDMLEAIDYHLHTYPHVGIAPREGANFNTDSYAKNTRLMRVLGYDKGYLRNNDIHFTPMQLMEDFHVSLQILESGADTLMLNRWCNNQVGGSNAEGGCSAFRTAALQEEQANLLHALHPDFVTVTQKATKVAWGGVIRTDVRINWKGARRYGPSRQRNVMVDQ